MGNAKFAAVMIVAVSTARGFALPVTVPKCPDDTFSHTKAGGESTQMSCERICPPWKTTDLDITFCERNCPKYFSCLRNNTSTTAVTPPTNVSTTDGTTCPSSIGLFYHVLTRRLQACDPVCTTLNTFCQANCPGFFACLVNSSVLSKRSNSADASQNRSGLTAALETTQRHVRDTATTESVPRKGPADEKPVDNFVTVAAVLVFLLFATVILLLIVIVVYKTGIWRKVKECLLGRQPVRQVPVVRPDAHGNGQERNERMEMVPLNRSRAADENRDPAALPNDHISRPQTPPNDETEEKVPAGEDTRQQADDSRYPYPWGDGPLELSSVDQPPQKDPAEQDLPVATETVLKHE